MDETTKNVLLLVVGALLSFVPQEISRWLQAKRDVEKEQRLVKQERRQKVWQLELDKLAKIETFISRMVIRQLEEKDNEEYRKSLRDDLFYLRTVLQRYPDIRQAFDEYTQAARSLKDARNSQAPVDTLLKAEGECNATVRHLFRKFDDHLNQDF